MERVRFALVAALVLVIVGAAPALAQRDPFDPIDSQGSDSGGSDSSGGPFTEPQTGGSDDSGSDTSGSSTGGSADDPTQPDTNPAPPESDPQVDPSDDTLPNTGAEPVSWLVVAYSLIAVGGGSMIAARFLHPSFVTRSDVPRRYQPRHSKRRS